MNVITRAESCSDLGGGRSLKGMLEELGEKSSQLVSYICRIPKDRIVKGACVLTYLLTPSSFDGFPPPGSCVFNVTKIAQQYNTNCSFSDKKGEQQCFQGRLMKGDQESRLFPLAS